MTVCTLEGSKNKPMAAQSRKRDSSEVLENSCRVACLHSGKGNKLDSDSLEGQQPWQQQESLSDQQEAGRQVLLFHQISLRLKGY